MSKGGSNRLMTADEVAAYIGVSVDTIYRRWDEWGMNGYRIGRALRFRERDVEGFIERCKT